MSRPIRFLALVGASAILLAACSAGTTPTPAATQPQSSGTGGGGTGASAVVATRDDSQLGTILVDANGRTLYLFEKDTNGTSACADACAKIWPPLTTDGAPQPDGSTDGSLLGTTQRDDGTLEVTYNDHPLYYYEPDSGQSTFGEGLDQFGAEWYVVSPAGDKVENAAEGS